MTEGVETVDQRTILQDLGCRGGQGLLFSKPEPAERLQGRLAALRSA